MGQADAAARRLRTALTRAGGTRVLDDVKRLKKAERNRRQQKRKAQRALKERERSVKMAQRKKQQKREENIKKRSTASVDRLLKKKGLKN